MRKMKSVVLLPLAIGIMLISACLAQGQEQIRSAKPDIRKLSQYFTSPGSASPWIFEPQENIKRIDTTEHPGMLTIWEAGRGKDIKGILKKPIAIGDYPLPWEFNLAFDQSMWQFKGVSDKQVNYAIGLNLAVTFSDPSTWPRDRSQLPPDTHSFQLFVVHLGNYGEMYRQGLPQVKNSALNYHDPSPEVYLVYGRGDLAPNVVGNWNIPYFWTGYQPPEQGDFEAAFGWSWEAQDGPASNNVRFRVRMVSPTHIEVGFGYGNRRNWRMRKIDTSRFGKITGIWEIGPIISLDRWIPDVLAPQLGIQPPPKVEAPDPTFEYFVDYAAFFGTGPGDLEQLSSDFDIPGYGGTGEKWILEGSGDAETFSHPGYLTVRLWGTNGGWDMCPVVAGRMTAGLGYLDFTEFKPPFEIETAFIAPDDRIPWNLWLTLSEGQDHAWLPGVQNIPGSGVHFINYFRSSNQIESSPGINVGFAKPVPQSIMAHKPLYMLVQIIDASHVRVGFKAHKNDAWYLSNITDTGKMQKIQLPCFASHQGRKGELGWGVGKYPQYEILLFDYVHFRYGLSASVTQPASGQ